MYPSISDAVILMALACFSFVVSRVFRREVEPSRRRDLTLANADDPEGLEERLARATRYVVILVAGLVLLDIVMFVVGIKVLKSGQFVSSTIGSVVWVFTVMITLIPMSHGVISYMAAKSCRKNQPLPALAPLIGVLVPVGVFLQMPLVLALTLESEFLNRTADPHGLKAALGVSIIVVSLVLSAFFAFVFPVMAHNRLLKAYPYSE
jgi:cytochrome bd-type quinol oxidase subunit 2